MVSLSLNSSTVTAAAACLFVFLEIASAFVTVQPLPTAATCINNEASRQQQQTSSPLFSSVSAQDLLYQDQQDAMLRRALREQELLSQNNKMKELLAPKLKAKPPKSGTGFGNVASNKAYDPAVQLAKEQAKVVRKEGVIRIDGIISDEIADSLRGHILEQQQIAAIETHRDVSTSRIYYGVENRRKSRCDLQLSLLRGGFSAYLDDEEAFQSSYRKPHIVADALQEMLGKEGSLRYLYENLVTPDGELYELAAVITDPGSNRQMVHPDLPYNSKAPLYVIFLALQDVTESMGPTSFLLRTHTSEANVIFNSGDAEQKEQLLLQSDCRLSTLKKGDAVLFDARLLHCGNANDEATRVLFNFSFRNPEVKGNLGYDGSIRPGYEGTMSLSDMGNALDAYSLGDENPFAKYVA
ncbi:hypothetical protein ACHAXM_007768 [Skeletonema potamos]